MAEIDRADLATLRAHTDQHVVGRLLDADGHQVESDGSLLALCCPWHQEATPSCKVYEDGGLHCFGGCGQKTAIDYLTHYRELSFREAVRVLAEETGFWPTGLDAERDQAPAAKPKPPPPPTKPTRNRKWHPIMPVPDHAPPLTADRLRFKSRTYGQVMKPTTWWEYRDTDGRLLMVDARYDLRRQRPADKPYRTGHQVEHEGRRYTVVEETAAGMLKLEEIERLIPRDAVLHLAKEVVTWCWAHHSEKDKTRWATTRPQCAPLYGLDRLGQATDSSSLVFCEGCKASDAAQAILGAGHVCMSWAGGSDAIANPDRNDWSPVAGYRCAVWPDADEPGRKAAYYLAKHLLDAGATSVAVVKTAGLPKGWDLADL
jgi:hypothetical protein